jgi:adenylate cyclase
VKGKTQPIDLFEPLGPAGAVDPSLAEFAERYEQALDLFRQRAFGDARLVLDDLVGRHPEDGPSQRLRRLVAEYVSSPPPPDWDGVTNFDVK